MHLKRLSVAYILPEDNIYAFRIVCDDQGVWDESFSHHHHHHHRKGFSDPLPVDKLMMRECPYSTKPREVLRNPSPLPSRFPSGFALGKSLGSQEISRPSGMDFPIPPELWWSTDTMILSHVFNVGDNECCGNECCNECQCSARCVKFEKRLDH